MGVKITIIFTFIGQHFNFVDNKSHIVHTWFRQSGQKKIGGSSFRTWADNLIYPPINTKF